MALNKILPMKKIIFNVFICSLFATGSFAQMKSSVKNLPFVFKMLQKPSYRQVMTKIQSSAESNLAENKLSVKEPYLIYTRLWDSGAKIWRADTLEKYVIKWNKNKSLQSISDISWDSVTNGAVINTIETGFVKINSEVGVDNNVMVNYFPSSFVTEELVNGKWVNYEQDIVSFDQSNRITSVLVQQWASNAWVNYAKDDITYDIKGNLIGVEAYYAVGNSWTLIQGIRESYTFNGGGFISSMTQTESTGGPYVNNTEELFTLDGNGAITTAIISTYDSLSGLWAKYDSLTNISWLYFNPIVSVDYATLGTDGILAVGGNKYLGYIETKYDSSLNEWVSPQKNIFTYNADSLPTNTIIQDKIKTGWVNNTSDSTSYYPRDDIKTYLSRYWTGAKWLNTSQGNNNINTYDVDGDITECIAQNTDQNNPNAFDNYSKTEYLYNSITGIEPVSNATFKIYPNPASIRLNIDMGQNEFHGVLTILDLTGKIIQSQNLSGGNLSTVDVSGLPMGMYFVSINSGYEVTTSKFIKE